MENGIETRKDWIIKDRNYSDGVIEYRIYTTAAKGYADSFCVQQ